MSDSYERENPYYFLNTVFTILIQAGEDTNEMKDKGQKIH